mgnify:CR=1 FL=1
MASLKNHRNAGYTLVELMIVLIILSTATAITIVSYSSLADGKTVDHFFEQLEDDLYNAQMLALSKGKTISIHFKPELHRYTVDGSVGERFLERHYDESIRITKGSTGYRIYFNANGNIRNPGTLIIDTKKGKYVLTFQIGKGRFYVRPL